MSANYEVEVRRGDEENEIATASIETAENEAAKGTILTENASFSREDGPTTVSVPAGDHVETEAAKEETMTVLAAENNVSSLVSNHATQAPPRLV